MIETTILDNIIVGRIDPHIYAFSTNTVPNYLKVGDTYRPVSVRLKEWEQVFPNLEHIEDWEWTAKTENGKYFRDFAVHYYLEEIKKLHRLQKEDIPGLPYYSKEFFENATPEDIDEAILDIEIKANQIGGPYQFFSEERLHLDEHYERNESYDPRPNQKETILRFNEARENGRRNLLMYAVMRFGKSFTSMCCATEMEAKTVLIVSAKADVKNEWKKTVESHIRFKDYSFLDSTALLSDTKAVTNILQKGKRAAIFLTLQDLMGDEIKDKHKDIFNNQIDLLIVDETHFGARAEEYGKVLRQANLTNAQIKKELTQSDNTLDELEDGLEIVKSLKVDTTLHLSGTPYRILMGSEFKPEDIIAFYQFTDIIDDKDQWDEKHLSDDESKEWDNPYYGFPQMVRFAFNPNESARKMLDELKKQGKTAALSELFRPISISKDTSKAKGHLHFLHEKEVLDLLQIIDGSKEDENILSFLDYQKIKDGSMCHHIVCVLPYCASCDALEKLLNDNSDKFKILSEYTIVNISGLVGNQFTSTEQIKNHIRDIEARGEKSITLTVNKMLTGSTVKEWDTMLFLKDVSSPQEYDQAIFRLQNQYVKTYEDDNGDTICYNMKPQTLLVDFDPNRMFVMQEQKSKIYNVNTEERGNEELEERIRKELKISPIIVANKGKLNEVVPTDIMDAVRQYSASRTVMDEAREIPTDYTLLQDPQIQLLIDGLEPINAQKGINIKPVEGVGDEVDNPDDGENNPDENHNNGSGGSGNTSNTNQTEKDDADKRLATYFAQILFFALLTDDEVSSLAEIVKVIRSDINNMRIARNVGLKASSLSYLYRSINPFILQDLDYKIQNINELAHDTSLEPLIRVERALKKFGRLSISEIVTPSHVASDIVALIPEEDINEETRFLDIASKQAEFACALYKRFGEKVKNNIVSLPTSSLTYEFTRKVYKLLELPLNNIISSFSTYDLIGKNQETIINILKNMKFNAIVGNPPYQLTVAKKDTENGQKRVSSIFHIFQIVAEQIGDYTVLIYPGVRWIHRSGKGLEQFGMKQINDPHLSKLYFFPDANEVFEQVSLADGLSIVVKNMSKKENGFEYGYIENGNKQTVMLDNPGVKLMPLDPNNENIVKCINRIISDRNFEYLNKSVLSQKLFAIESDFVETNPTLVRPYTKDDSFDKSCEIKLLTNDKSGKSGRAKWYIANRNVITSGLEYLDRWKVVVSSANAGGQKRSNQLEILDNYSAFGRVKVALKTFETEKEANNFYKYVDSELIRFTFLLTDEALTSLAKQVPDIINYKDDNGIIDFEEDINEQLYSLFEISPKEQEHIKLILQKKGHKKE